MTQIIGVENGMSIEVGSTPNGFTTEIKDSKGNPIGVKKKPVMVSSKALDRFVIKALRSEPFYSAFSRSIPKVFSTRYPTAFVSLNSKGQPFMGIHPDFFKQVSETGELKHFSCQLFHEFLHVIMGHLTGRKPQSTINGEIVNVAMDAAIDEFLIGDWCNTCPIKNGCIRIGKNAFGKQFPDVNPLENYESILLKMMDKLQQNKKDGKGQGDGKSGDGQGNGQGSPMDGINPRDDHSAWQEMLDENGNPVEMTEQDQARLEAEIKQAIRQACDKAGKNGGDKWGSVPREVQVMIAELLEGSGAIDWKEAFKNTLKCSQLSTKRNSWVRRHRKLPNKLPGGRRKRTIPNCLIAIDESGSVSDEMLEAFGSTLPDLSELANFTLIKFDTQVYESHDYKKGDSIEYTRECTGGTDFDAPTQYANDGEFDMLVVITDMCAPEPINCYIPRIWITDPNNFESHFQTREEVLCLQVD